MKKVKSLSEYFRALYLKLPFWLLKIFGVKKSKSGQKDKKESGSGDKGLEGNANGVSWFTFSYLKSLAEDLQTYLVDRFGESNAGFLGYCFGLLLGAVCSIAILLLLLKTGML